MALSKKKNNESKNMHFSREDQKKILSSSSPFIVKEAYSSIRTNLLFSQKGVECPVFIVTSPLPTTVNQLTVLIWQYLLLKWERKHFLLTQI